MSAQGRLSPLASPTATREVLRDHGLSAKYSLGQNFLVSDEVVRRIIELARLSPDDDVLEVGPGIGTLTAALLKSARRVAAVECDPDLPAVLADTLAPWEKAFTLVRKDALDLRPDDLPFAPVALVSNLPYAVAATVVLDYLQRFPSLRSATVMVQKEVADRMAARPSTKSYGAYTVKLALHARMAGRFSVGPGNFMPPPRVTSSVVRLERRPATGDAAVLRAACTMADAAFCARRKTILNSCKAYFRAQGAEEALGRIPEVLERAGVDPACRGETLEAQAFVRLGQAYLAEGGRR